MNHFLGRYAEPFRPFVHPSMASRLYKDRLIVAEAAFDAVAGRWRVIIDVTQRVGRHHRVLRVSSEGFDSRDEAETSGVKIGQDWIDQER